MMHDQLTYAAENRQNIVFGEQDALRQARKRRGGVLLEHVRREKWYEKKGTARNVQFLARGKEQNLFETLELTIYDNE